MSDFKEVFDEKKITLRKKIIILNLIFKYRSMKIFIKTINSTILE